MRIAVLGTGAVGQALASRLVEVGHEVVLGSRDAANPRAVEWTERTGGRAGTFADAAAHGAVVVNATAGTASLAALAAAGGGDALAGKVLIDVANPLDFSGDRPVLAIANTDSLAERIQREYPDARVVKALNTVNVDVMVHPERLPGPHTIFLAGDDADAKRVTTSLLGQFGWPSGSVLDLGGIGAARGMEMYLPLWLSMMSAQGTVTFNIHVVRAP
jgi:predicted dinucleotide-binding enzyme